MGKEKQDNGIRFLAVLLTLSGILGIGFSAIQIYLTVQKYPLFLAITAAIILVHLWSAITGIRLWKYEPRGWLWAKILFAVQIPMISVLGFQYEFHTGLAVVFSAGHVYRHFNMYLIPRALVFFESRFASDTYGIYGINLSAFAALAYLMVKSRPLSLVDTETQNR